MTTWITRQEAAAHLLPKDGDRLAVVEADIRLGLEDAAAGRVVEGEALVADLMSAYESAFGHRTGGTGR